MSDSLEPKFEFADWELLKKLRTVFLSESFLPEKEYWSSERLLELYHQTFAQRIGWKWDAVLKEVCEFESFEIGTECVLLDYGCGTGIAARKLLENIGAEKFKSIQLWDKSDRAMSFAASQLKAMFPKVKIEKMQSGKPPELSYVLCLSHVINELSEVELLEIIELVKRATFVFWVEPGTYSSSRKLVEVRERVLPEIEVIAPCTHQTPCGLLTEKNSTHWCHYFASPPKEIFQSSFWNRFGRELQVDLRALPTSYLVLSKKGKSTDQKGGARVIGRPRLYKGNGKFLLCDNTGVEEAMLLERENRGLFKDYKRDIFSKKIPKSESK